MKIAHRFLILILLGIGSAQGQVLKLEPGQKELKPRAPRNANTQDAENSLSEKKVILSPRSEPDPALMYQLWVSPNLRQPGNAVAPTLRAQVLWLEKKSAHAKDDSLNKAWKWLELPIDDLPQKEVREFIDQHSHVLHELHAAEKMERIDYDMRIQDLRGPDVFATLLPELQVCRDLARLLSLEARLALKEKRFDDAIASLRSGVRLSEISAQMGSATLIGQLVSIAIASTMLQVIEEAMQIPEAPNFYWALASIPDSFGDMRMALEGEALAVRHVFHHMMDLPQEPASEAVWQAHLQATMRDFLTLHNSVEELRTAKDDYAALFSGALLGAYGDTAIEEIKKREPGREPSRAEAILKMTRLEILRAQSDFFKWVLLPANQRKVYLDQAEKSLFELKSKYESPAVAIVGLVFPAVNSASAAGSRFLMHRNFLISVEALRAHAAVHEGKLPESLEELSPLPAWMLPHNQTFPEYQLVSDREATLKRASVRPQDPVVLWKLRFRDR